MDNLILKIAQKLGRALNRSEQDILTVNYGLAVLWHSLTKTLIILLIGYLTNTLFLVFVSMVCQAAYRSYAGGVHLKTYLSCLITNSVCVFGAIWLATHINFSIYFLIGLYVVCFLLTYKYAPADTDDNPVVSKRERKKRKTSALLLLLLTFPMVLYLHFYFIVISNIALIFLGIATIFILPFTYKLLDIKYGRDR